MHLPGCSQYKVLRFKAFSGFVPRRGTYSVAACPRFRDETSIGRQKYSEKKKRICIEYKAEQTVSQKK